MISDPSGTIIVYNAKYKLVNNYFASFFLSTQEPFPRGAIQVLIPKRGSTKRFRIIHPATMIINISHSVIETVPEFYSFLPLWPLYRNNTDRSGFIFKKFFIGQLFYNIAAPAIGAKYLWYLSFKKYIAAEFAGIFIGHIHVVFSFYPGMFRLPCIFCESCIATGRCKNRSRACSRFSRLVLFHYTSCR